MQQSLIYSALSELKLCHQKCLFWEVQIQNAITRPRHAGSLDKKQRLKAFSSIRAELNNFHRSNKNNTKSKLIQGRWIQLSTKTRVFINFQIKAISQEDINFF